jgi:hypothetical protein
MSRDAVNRCLGTLFTTVSWPVVPAGVEGELAWELTVVAVAVARR